MNYSIVKYRKDKPKKRKIVHQLGAAKDIEEIIPFMMQKCFAS